MDVVNMLLKLGMNRQTATMAIPYVWFLPQTSDPYAAPVIMLVLGIQKFLAVHGGYVTAANGHLDKRTDAALVRLVSPSWRQMTWSAVIGRLLERKDSMRAQLGSLGPVGMGCYGSLGEVGPAMPTDFYQIKSGLAIPLNSQGLAYFKNLQAQANRVAPRHGIAQIAVDGRIGPGTVSLVNRILQPQFIERLIGRTGVKFTVETLAPRADLVANEIKRLADGFGIASTNIVLPALSFSTGPSESALVPAAAPSSSFNPSAIAEALKTPKGMAIAGGLVFGLLVLHSRMKKAGA